MGYDPGERVMAKRIHFRKSNTSIRTVCGRIINKYDMDYERSSFFAHFVYYRCKQCEKWIRKNQDHLKGKKDFGPDNE